MNNIKKKAVAVLGAATIIGTSVFTGAMAAGTDVVGKIANMKIFNNGAAISIPSDQQPIIVNNRTYLPVRALGEALGKQVSWNQNDPNSVYISAGINEQDYSQLAIDLSQARIQIIDKESKIKELETKIKSLEEELKKKEDTSYTLSDLEKKLDKDFDRYEGIYFGIKVKGTEKRIDIQVTVESKYERDWEDLSLTKKERYIKDIVYAVEKEFKNAQIEGSVYSGSKTTEIFFEVDSKGKLYIGDDGYSSGSRSKLTQSEITRLEEDLESDFKNDIIRAYIEDDGDFIDVEVKLKDNVSVTVRSEIEKDIKDYLIKKFDRKGIYVTAYYEK